MEVAGLVLGAARLAGLFSACLDCFALIDSGHTHGRDLEILLTKLDVEKTRLLQWGDAVGLLSSYPRSRNTLLDVDHTRSMIERVLNCIFMLLTDTDKLRSKYGMHEDSPQGGSNVTSTHLAIVSRSRLSSFTNAYAAFRSRISLQQRSAAPLAKLK
jgi:Prion-inhibition and propagation